MNVRKINKILISQPKPNTEKSPYFDIAEKFNVDIHFYPFIRVDRVSTKEFRQQRINILDHTAIIFTARTAVDKFFSICEEMKISIPETMKYFCQSEAIALYLQKYIIYRKRKIFFGNGTTASLIDCIGSKHKGEYFLISSTDAPKKDIEDMFTNAKFKFGSAVMVQTVYSDIKNIDLSKYGMLVFYSPADVKSLFENHPDFTQNDLLIATYGKNTAKAVKDASLSIEIEAPTPESPSIAAALSNYFGK